jgi:hypothetical protein
MQFNVPLIEAFYNNRKSLVLDKDELMICYSNVMWS